MLKLSRSNAWLFVAGLLLAATPTASAQEAAKPIVAANKIAVVNKTVAAKKAEAAKSTTTSAAAKAGGKSVAKQADKQKDKKAGDAPKAKASEKSAKATSTAKTTTGKVAGKAASDKKTADKKATDRKNVAAQPTAKKTVENKTVAPAPGQASPAPAAAAIAGQKEPEQAAADAPETADKGENAVAAAEDRKGWKLVSTPLPPVLNKALRIAAAKADKDKTRTDRQLAAAKGGNDITRHGAAAPEIQAAAPPEPRRTGIFALFGAASTNQAADDSNIRGIPATASSFARVEGPSTRVASLSLPNTIRGRKPNNNKQDDDLEDEEDDDRSDGPRLESGFAGIEKQVASVQTSCLNPQLVAMVQQAGRHFGGTPVITSGYRNRGRRGSFHRRCAAVDFQIPGVAAPQIVAYLRALPGAGGVGTYCHTKSVHLDTGTPRDWHQCLFTRRFALRAPIVAASQ